MIVPDSSVLVAGYVADHDFYDVAKAVVFEVRAEGRLLAHTMAETYAVLSAPAGVYRVDPAAVLEYLKTLLEDSLPVQPRPGSYMEALELLPGEGRGGADSAAQALTRVSGDAAQPRSPRKADQRGAGSSSGSSTKS